MEEYTLYGHISNFESTFKYILIVIVTTLEKNPDARVIIFEQHTDGFNRLFFFNAMQNFLHPQKG